MTITWIRGRTPTLTVKRDGDEQDSIDLSPFNEEKLHALFVSKGLVRKPIDNDLVAKNEKFLKKNGNRPNLRRGAPRGPPLLWRGRRVYWLFRRRCHHKPHARTDF